MSSPEPLSDVEMEEKGDSKFIKLKSSDGEMFKVEEKVARMSKLINDMIEDLGLGDEDDDIIPLTKISARILKFILKWAEYHQNDPVFERPDEERNEFIISDWDRDFLLSLNPQFPEDKSTLYELLTAANFLHVHGLLEVTSKFIADMIIGKPVEQIRADFDITNDFTPEEEAAIRASNEWAESFGEMKAGEQPK